MQPEFENILMYEPKFLDPLAIVAIIPEKVPHNVSTCIMCFGFNFRKSLTIAQFLYIKI